MTGAKDNKYTTAISAVDLPSSAEPSSPNADRSGLRLFTSEKKTSLYPSSNEDEASSDLSSLAGRDTGTDDPEIDGLIFSDDNDDDDDDDDDDIDPYVVAKDGADAVKGLGHQIGKPFPSMVPQREQPDYSPSATILAPDDDTGLSIPPSDDLLPEPAEEKAARNQRLKVMEELVSSEQVYVSSLRVLCEIFAPALSNAAGVDAVVTILFNNISHIYSLNQELLNELEHRLIAWKEGSCSTVTDIFNEQISLFWFYSRFSVNLSAALEKIRAYKRQEPFRRSIEECERGREPLESLLIKPIQRIPRYILLLNDMARKSETHDPDVDEIKVTVSALEKVADSLNESVREREGMESLIRLQKLLGRKVDLVVPGRRILFDGMLWKVDRTGQPIRMHWHLFTDQLMFSRISPLATSGLYKHRFLALKNLHVDWDNGGYDFQNAFMIRSPRKSFVVFSDTEAGARKWFNAIVAAIQAYADDNGLAAAPIRSPHAANECSLCHITFTMLHRRHHCRACGSVVCSACSNHRELLTAIDPQAKQRVCDSCYEDMDDDKIEELAAAAPRPSKTIDMVNSWRNSMKKMISRHSQSSASSDRGSVIIGKLSSPDSPSSRASGARALSTIFSTRREVVEELLRTESAFLADISSTLDVIITPVVTQLKSSDSLKRIHPELIAAFEALEMIRTLSQTVIADLDLELNTQSPPISPRSPGRRISHPTTATRSPSNSGGAGLSTSIPADSRDPFIGDIFERRANLFSLFGEYAGHLSKVHTVPLYPDVESRITALESDPRCGGIPFRRRLLMPLQRPAAYTFLLSKLVRLTAESHQDYGALQSAIEHTTAASKMVSSAMKAGGQRAKIAALEAEFHGKINLTDETELIRTGKVLLFDAKEQFAETDPIPNFDQVTLHLLNDRLIVSHGDSKRGFKVDYDLVQSKEAWFEMDEEAARVLSRAQPLDDGARYSVVRLHYVNRNIFGLVLKEPAQKRSWVNDLQLCIHRSASAIT